jgi:DNA-binding transcriptional regulator GbsR (MarR family)
MNIIALNWDAISLQDITAKTHRAVETVSTTLHELEQVFLIQRSTSDTHQRLYYVTERFFNIWYLMRVAPRRSHTRVRWLVRFLESWYTPAELHMRVRQHLQAVRRGSFTPTPRIT